MINRKFEENLNKIKAIAIKSFNESMGEEAEYSIHGIEHWKEVEKNGILLSTQKGVDERVVRIFAYLHDCKREDDGRDMFHGHRSSDFISELIDEGLLDFLNVAQLMQLKKACLLHHQETVDRDDLTVGACYDADRLELTRVNIIADPKLMSTPIGIKMAEKMQSTEDICRHYYY